MDEQGKKQLKITTSGVICTIYTLFLIAVFIAYSSPKIGLNAGNFRESEAISQTCGGVLTGATGSIVYKTDEPFSSNERCSWTVHSPNASTIIFTISRNGFIQNVEDYIKIGYFLDSDYKTLGNYQEILMNHNGTNTVEVPGPVAFVRFFSDSSVNGEGFQIDFKGKTTGITLPFKYRNFYWDENWGDFEYVNYKPLERISIFFKPRNMTQSTYLALKYYYGNCGVQQDYLTVYMWSPDPYGNSYNLQMVQQFCNSSVNSIPYWSFYSSSAEYFVTFHSSISGANRGFGFMWVPNS